MDQDGPPAAKKMRYSLRSTPARRKIATDNTHQHRYMLRSKTLERKKIYQNLMILNDDCLLKIIEFLKPMELSNMAQVNNRLKDLVKYHIQIKYKIQFAKNFELIPQNDTIRINLEVFKVFLSIFGEETQALKLFRYAFDRTYRDYSSLFEFVQKYCTNLKDLTLKDFSMWGLDRNFYKKLKILTLENCSVSRNWCKMPQLETLKLDQVIFRRWPEHTSVPVQRFGGLKEVQCSDVNIQNEDLKNLIKSNPKLKRLSVIKSYESSPKFFSALPILMNLEEFEFKKLQGCRMSDHELNSLVNLKKLKTLKFSYKNYSALELVNGFIKNDIGIENLELSNGRFDDKAADRISELQTLKVLKLNDMNGLNASHLIQMANALKMLEELQIKTDSHITQDDIKEIVDAAKHLKCLKIDVPKFALDVVTYRALLVTIQEREKQNKPLELMIYGNEKQLLVPNEMMTDQNEEWFVVKQIEGKKNRLVEDLTSTVGPPPPRYEDDFERRRLLLLL